MIADRPPTGDDLAGAGRGRYAVPSSVPSVPVSFSQVSDETEEDTCPDDCPNDEDPYPPMEEFVNPNRTTPRGGRGTGRGCSCSIRCSLCGRHIPHGRFFFALTRDRYGCLRCVEQHDLYDEITDPGTDAAA